MTSLAKKTFTDTGSNFEYFYIRIAKFICYMACLTTRLQHNLITPVNQVFNLFRPFSLTNCDLHKEISAFIAAEGS